MSKKIKYNSTCCNAKAEVACGIPDFGKEYGRGQTCHYECQKCKKSCDIKEVK